MMIEKIIPWVKGKKVLILGFGREGKSTWNVLKKLDCCEQVDVDIIFRISCRTSMIIIEHYKRFLLSLYSPIFQGCRCSCRYTDGPVKRSRAQVLSAEAASVLFCTSQPLPTHADEG